MFHNSELVCSSGTALVTVPSRMYADGTLYSFAMPLLGSFVLFLANSKANYLWLDLSHEELN